eukprot:10898900-Prorocentrum_lima.AAC.1
MMVEPFFPEALVEIYSQWPAGARPMDAVMDGGARSFVVGENTLVAYSEHPRTNGAKEPVVVE